VRFQLVVAALSLAAFLGGLSLMRQGLSGMGNHTFQRVLQRLVRTPTRGILTGTVVTAVVQSSAAITAITVGMVAGGSIAFREALGIILGANVGSTITPQLLTLNLQYVVFACLLLGMVGFVSRKAPLVHPSMALVGFSIIFIALETLKLSLRPLAALPWFQSTLAYAGPHPLIGVIAGCFVSAIIQSSTATTVVAMALASQFMIPMTGAIAIVLGANIGTCLTSVIASIGQGRPAQQVALSHVLLNVGGVALFVPFLTPFQHWMVMWTRNPAQQIANAHTLFNIICTLLVWPFVSAFARFIETILPDNRYA
jgi:phosphate:Na+ symporter